MLGRPRCDGADESRPASGSAIRDIAVVTTGIYVMAAGFGEPRHVTTGVLATVVTGRAPGP